MEVQRHPDNEPVLAAIVEVHRQLGPGLLESSYCACLARELQMRQVAFQAEVPLPLVYKDLQLDCGYRLDFLVNGELIIEVKSVSHIEPIHVAQVLTYLRLTRGRQAFLVNFNVASMKNGLRSYLGAGTEFPSSRQSGTTDPY